MSEEPKYENVYFTSLEDIEISIKKGDVHAVCRSMPAVGMDCEYNAQVKSLIEHCLKNNEEWIRRSALLCLHYLQFQYKEAMFDADFKRFVKLGYQDDSVVVKEIAEVILSRLEEFYPKVYKSFWD